MNNPTFKLEGIVRSKDVMEDFEGPLTLILQLLSKNKIEIKDIRISLILDQYLQYLDEMAAMDLEVASEFVAMASHLVYIKARTLIAGDEEVSELEQLISSLEELKSRDRYVQIKTMTDQFAELYKCGGGLFVKPPEYLPVNSQYTYTHDKEDLLTAICAMFDREEGAGRNFSIRNISIPQRIVYSVADKALEIVDRLRKIGVVRVGLLLYESKSRSEVVATFIAILELCKTGNVCLAGEDEDFTITYTGTGELEFSEDYEQGETEDGNP